MIMLPWLLIHLIQVIHFQTRFEGQHFVSACFHVNVRNFKAHQSSVPDKVRNSVSLPTVMVQSTPFRAGAHEPPGPLVYMCPWGESQL